MLNFLIPLNNLSYFSCDTRVCFYFSSITNLQRMNTVYDDYVHYLRFADEFEPDNNNERMFYLEEECDTKSDSGDEKTNFK